MISALKYIENLDLVIIGYGKVEQELKEFVENMRATSSSLEKVEIIKGASKYVHEVLEYTYNPVKQYSVTSKTIIKKGDVGVTQSRYHYYSDLFDLLEE